MAERAIKKLDEQLTCAICLDTYSDPKLLRCFHIYCRNCLVKLVIRDQLGELSLPCPTCRQATPVPSNGVTGLPPAFHINHLLEIRKSFEEAEDPPASPKIKEIIGVSSPCTPTEKVATFCSEHNKEQELYCETCGKLICFKCAIKSGKHEGHNYDELCNAFSRYKKRIISSLKPLEQNLTSVDKALAELNERCIEISDQQETVEANIHNTIKHLHEVLDVRKIELVSQLHQITQDKLKGLATQKESTETLKVQLSSCLEFLKRSLKTGNQGEVLKMRTVIDKQVNELTSPLQIKTNTEADITFSVSQEVTAVCQNYGIIYAAKEPYPPKCHITGKGLDVAVVGEKSTAVLQMVNFIGEPLEEPVDLQCKLVSDIMGASVEGSIEKSRQGQYEISYQPMVKGKHQLHIKVEGQHIRESPFTTVTKLPIEKLGTPVSTIGWLNTPWGVAVNQSGEVIVTEHRGHRISVVSPCGEKIRSFGTRGSGRGQFDYPLGVAVDGEQNILVADGSNHRIQKFTTDGRFLSMVGTEGSGHLQFSSVTSIAYNASNNKYYVVDENNRIQILNSDLTFYDTFGKPGSGKGQFNTPRCITCDNAGNVYVADTYNNRIQIFTAKGKFLRIFSKRSQGGGELCFPVGIAIDSNNILYVSENRNNRVSVFTSEGQFLTSFGREGGGPGELNHPRSLAIDTSGMIYLCDCNNNRIQVF